MRFASNLPERLIDSIMAQGNWNLLFQEGPFNEFQRQIAIANYFALRGSNTQAEFYFKRADAALTIAYGSLRGKYDWPRQSQNIMAKDLPWGENRDTFQDYVLCSLQLFLESGLSQHESGQLSLTATDATIAAAEKQLSVPLRQKDGDLHSFVAVLQEALKIRQSKALNALEKADRFDKITVSQPLSLRNYWNRRSILFRLFENIFHGNLGRANAIAEFLQEKQGDQLDSLVLARIFTATTSYDRALAVVTEAQNNGNLQLPENYANFTRHSLLRQNLYLWTGRPAMAEKSAAQTAEHIQNISTSPSIRIEDRLDLRKSFLDQQLRTAMFAYLDRKVCPALVERPDSVDMDAEWRVKERLFLERCGMPRQQQWWAKLHEASGGNRELKAIAAFSQGALSQDLAKPFPELQYLLKYQNLRQAIGAGVKKQSKTKQVAEYLAMCIMRQHDFIFLDWGLVLPEITDEELKPNILGKSDEATAAAIFLGLHRRFAEQLARGQNLSFFSPPDAAELLAHRSEVLLDQTRESPGGRVNLRPRQRLRYVSAGLEIFYDSSAGSISLTRPVSTSNQSLKPVELSFGSAIFSDSETGLRKSLSPLYFWCENCGNESGRAARLLMAKQVTKAWQITHTEIADNFSQATLYSEVNVCDSQSASMNDTLLIENEASLKPLETCALRLNNVVVDVVKDQTSDRIRLIALSMGWRTNLSFIILRAEASRPFKTSLLFDYFQKRNRREIGATDAFFESLRRAEKSFPAESAFERVHFYAGME